MALLNCVQRPQDPGGPRPSLGPVQQQLQGGHEQGQHHNSIYAEAIQAEAAFWEDKCHALLRELEAAHDVSQAMVREYSAALQEKSLESSEWQQRLADALADVKDLEAERDRCREDAGRTLRQLNDCEIEAQQQRDLAGRLREQLADSDREALRWREHAERAVADLQSTQERARAAFGKLIARHKQLQMHHEQVLARRATAVDKCVGSDEATRTLSRSVQCEPSRQHVGTDTPRAAVPRHAATNTPRDYTPRHAATNTPRDHAPRNVATNTPRHPARRHRATSTPRCPATTPRAPRPERPDTETLAEDGVVAQSGAGDGVVDLLQRAVPPGPPSPAVVVTENLLDVSVDRLGELLQQGQTPQLPPPLQREEFQWTGLYAESALWPEPGLADQEHMEHSEPDGDRDDLDELEGVLAAVRARLVEALHCHLAQRHTARDVRHEDSVRHDDSEDLEVAEASTATWSPGLQSRGSQSSHDWPEETNPQPHCVAVGVQVHIAVDESTVSTASVACQSDAVEITFDGFNAEKAYLRAQLDSERRAVAELNRSLGSSLGAHRRLRTLKRLGRRAGCGRPRPRIQGPTLPCRRRHRRLRSRVRRHVLQQSPLEDAVRVVVPEPRRPRPQPVWRCLGRLGRAYLSAATSRARLGQRLGIALAELAEARRVIAEGEAERQRARGRIAFLQRRLQQLIHCSAVNARDLAALRSVHAKLTGELPGAGHLPGLSDATDEHDPYLLDKAGDEPLPDAATKKEPDQDAVDLDEAKQVVDDEVPPCEGGGDSVDACDQSCGPKWSDSQLDTTPTKLVADVADVADTEELAEVEATVSRVVRGLRGCSRGCGAAGAECLLLLRAVPRLVRQLLLERRRSRQADTRWWHCCPSAPSAPPNTPRDATRTPRAVALSRECAARLHAQSLAHHHHLQALRAQHHKYIQALREAHSQAIGKLVDRHAVALCHARDQLRAELRAEVQRELRRDMRAVVARSTAALEALHHAELNSLLRGGPSDPGQGVPQAAQVEDTDDGESGFRNGSPFQLKEWFEKHEALVVMQAASLALKSMDIGAEGDHAFPFDVLGNALTSIP